MSTLTTHTTASRDTHATGLCKFNTTSKAIEVSDGTNWQIYNKDSTVYPAFPNRYGIILDGTNDYLDIGTNGTISELGGASALSLTFWVKFHSRGGIEVVTSTGLTASQNIFSTSVETNKVCVYMNNTKLITSSSSITNGLWYHVAVFKNGTSASLYLNGSSEGSSSSAPSTLSSDASNSLAIGHSVNFSGYYIDGEFDEVAIWGSDQSSNISSIYTGTTPANLSTLNPAHWWRMGDGDSGTGTTVTDDGVASTLVDGTLTNGAAFQDLSTAPDSIYIA
jgi:hypothetical protein